MSEIDYRSAYFPVFIKKIPYERRIKYEQLSQLDELEVLKHSVLNSIEFLKGLEGNRETTIQYCINQAMGLRGARTPDWVTIDKLVKPTLIELKKNLLAKIEYELITNLDPDPED